MRQGRAGTVLAGVVALLAATVGVAVVTIAPAGAVTIQVVDEASYRAALVSLSANNTGPHVIDVAADFTITGGTDPRYNNTLQPLTIEGNGHTISGGGTRRILNQDTAQPLTVHNLTLTSGRAAVLGGAINARGSVTATDSTFTGNTVGVGGGGAIAALGSVTATGSTFTGNTARAGGAISAGSVTATASTFTGNTTTLGTGGAIRALVSATVTDSTFTNNTASIDGGAIAALVSVTATGSTFTGNTAAVDGGAIAVLVWVTATNSTFTGNTATNRAGGAIAALVSVTLVHATVVENTAPTGANLYAGLQLDSFGSVVALPLADGDNCALDGSSTSAYSYSDDDSCAFLDPTDVEHGPNPLLLALGNYGGPTETRPPQSNSLLVDAIPEDDCDPAVTTDQRGLPRPADSDGIGGDDCDIGAVELEPLLPSLPLPPPPPPPAEICFHQMVTVDLARGQSPTAGPDVIRGTPGDDIINALGGDDVICALSGDDIVSGNQGQDRVFGGSGGDNVRGNAGDDILRGRAGDDTLYGQAGDDVLDGGADTDHCLGGTGVDTAAACETTAGVP